MNPYRRYLDERRKEIDEFYASAPNRRLPVPGPRRLLRRSILRTLKAIIPPGRRVLDVGCGDGDLLEGLRPSRGLGIDLCSSQVETAARRAPGLEFRRLEAEDCGELGEKFDYILLVNVIDELVDLRAVLKQLRGLCEPDTRIILCTRSMPWWPVLAVTQKLGMSRKSLSANWLSRSDIETFVKLSDLETVARARFFPLPAPAIHGQSSPWRWLARLPGLESLGAYELTLLRPAALSSVAPGLTTTVVVPCKDEQDNIDEIVRRVPDFGGGVELVFVDDKSTDATAAKVKENIQRYPKKDIRLVEGPGRGKGAAVRAGLESASGDIYMILDADMTVAPEVLPEFYECLASQKADFVNGSRLVYPLVGQAMRSANIIGNHLFALLFSFLLRQRIKDTLCGTKAVRAADYRRILEARKFWEDTDRWGDYDWIFGAAKNYLKILELPVHYFERTAGQSKMVKRLQNAMIMLKMCWVAFRKLR